MRLKCLGVTGFESRGSLAFIRLYFFDFFTCSLPATIIFLHARKYSKKEKKINTSAILALKFWFALVIVQH